MTLADTLERLARVVPGVAGYQDRERARDADKAVRERLAQRLDAVRRDLEPAKRALIDAKDLGPLPSIDALAATLDEIARTVEYAARGYRGFFDTVTVDQAKLERLCTFDLALFDEVTALGAEARKVDDAVADRARLDGAVREMGAALERFQAAFARRQALLDGDKV